MNKSMRCDKMMRAGNGKQLTILEWPYRWKRYPCSQPSPILPSVCVHNKQHEKKKVGKAWGHSSNELTWDGRRGERPIFETKLESKFLTGQDEYVSITLKFGVQNCGRALERMIQCVAWWLGPYPPTSTSCPPSWRYSRNECFPGLPSFSELFCFCVLLWTKTEGKTRKAWEWGHEEGGPDSKCKVQKYPYTAAVLVRPRVEILASLSFSGCQMSMQGSGSNASYLHNVALSVKQAFSKDHHRTYQSLWMAERNTCKQNLAI